MKKIIGTLILAFFLCSSIVTFVSANSEIEEGIYNIHTSLNTGMALDISGQSKSDGANIHIWSNHSGDSQKFKIVKSGDAYSIINVLTGKAIDIKGGSKKSGANSHQWTPHTGNSQKWYFEDAGEGYYYIKSALGNYLDVSGGKSSNGTNVQVYKGNNTKSQKWLIKIVVDETKKPGKMSSYAEKALYTTKDNVILKWTSSSNADKYGLTVVRDGNNKVIYNGKITGTSINLGKLEPGTYRFNMRGYNVSGAGPLSKITRFTVKTYELSDDLMVKFIKSHPYYGYRTLFSKYAYLGEFLGELDSAKAQFKMSYVAGKEIITGLMQGRDYETIIIKKSLADVLAKVSDTEIEYTETPEWIKYTVSFLKKGGDPEKLLYDKNVSNNKIFKHLVKNKEFYKSFEKVGDIFKYGDIAVDQLIIWLTDYQKNIEYIESIRNGLYDAKINNSKLKNVLTDLQAEYTTRWFGSFNYVVDLSISKGFDSALNGVTGGLFSIADFGIDLVYYFTGWDDYADNMAILLGNSNYSYDIQKCYGYYADKIYSGKYSETDVELCKHFFNLCKQIKIQEYEKMSELSNSKSEKTKLREDISEIKKINYCTES